MCQSKYTDVFIKRWSFDGSIQIFELWEMIVYRLMKHRLHVDDTAFSIHVLALMTEFVCV